MWSVFAVLIVYIKLASASCPKDCRCPHDTPQCAAGVSLMVDDCGCCKVCARQLFDDCSEMRPCDRMKGLECNVGGGYGSVKGICRAKSDGRTCEYNNKIYQNGEIFQPNCKHQCTCMDGAVGCVSLCPNELTLLKKGCALPRRVKLPGRCCEQFVCHQEGMKEIYVLKKHKKKLGEHRRLSEDNVTNRKEFNHVWGGESKYSPVFSSHQMSHILVRGNKCVLHTTAWSPCSKSCGTGVSSRETNNNNQCKMAKETRICQVRPCNQTILHTLKKGQKCKHTEKASRPYKLSFAGCRSLTRFQPRFCGSCSDGRCCRPHRTQTSPERFRCRNGEITSKMVMMIESCKCDLDCPGINKKTAARYKLFNDTI